MIITFLCIPSIRTKLSFRYIIYLSMSDMVLNITSIIGTAFENHIIICGILGGIREYVIISSTLWVIIISKEVYKALKQDHNEIESNEKTSLLIGYGIPLLFACGFAPTYGYADLSCWIDYAYYDDKLTSILLLLGGYYLVLFGAIFVSIYYISKAIIMIKKKTQGQESRALYNRLYLYPCTLVLCSVFGIGNRIFWLITGHQASLIFLSLQLIIRQLQGFFNSMIYGASIRRMAVNKILRRESVVDDRVAYLEDNLVRSNSDFNESMVTDIVESESKIPTRYSISNNL